MRQCPFNQQCDVTIHLTQLTAETLLVGQELQNGQLSVTFEDASGVKVKASSVTLVSQSKCRADQELSTTCDGVELLVRTPSGIASAEKGVSIHVQGKDELKNGERLWLAAAVCADENSFTFKPAAEGDIVFVSVTSEDTNGGRVATFNLQNVPQDIVATDLTVQVGASSVSPTTLSSSVSWVSVTEATLKTTLSVAVSDYSCLEAECVVAGLISLMYDSILKQASFQYTYIGIASPVMEALSPTGGSTAGGTAIEFDVSNLDLAADGTYSESASNLQFQFGASAPVSASQVLKHNSQGKRSAGVACVLVTSPSASVAGDSAVTLTVTSNKFPDGRVVSGVSFNFFSGFSVFSVAPTFAYAGAATLLTVRLQASDSSVVAPATMEWDWPDCAALSASTVSVTTLSSPAGRPVEVSTELSVSGVSSCIGSERFTITASGFTAAEGTVTFISPPSTVTPQVIATSGYTVQASVYGLGTISNADTELDVILEKDGLSVVIDSIVLSNTCDADWTCMDITIPNQLTPGDATVTTVSASGNSTFGLTFVELSQDVISNPSRGTTSTYGLSTSVTFDTFPTSMQIDVRCFMGSTEIPISQFSLGSASASTTLTSSVTIGLQMPGMAAAAAQTVICSDVSAPELGTASFTFAYYLPAATLRVQPNMGSIAPPASTIELDLENVAVDSIDQVSVHFMSANGQTVPPATVELRYAVAATADSPSILKLAVTSPDSADSSFVGIGKIVVTPKLQSLPAAEAEFTLVVAAEIGDVTGLSNAACNETSACVLPSSGGSTLKFELTDFPYVTEPSEVFLQIDGVHHQASTVAIDGSSTGLTVTLNSPTAAGERTLALCTDSHGCQTSFAAEFQDPIRVTSAYFADSRGNYIFAHTSENMGSIGGVALQNSSQTFSCADVFDSATAAMLGGGACLLYNLQTIKVMPKYIYDANDEPYIKIDPRSSLTFIAGAIVDRAGLSAIDAQTVVIGSPEISQAPQGVSILGANRLNICPTNEELLFEASVAHYAGILTYSWRASTYIAGSAFSSGLSVYLEQLPASKSSFVADPSFIPAGSTVEISVTVTDLFGGEATSTHVVSREAIAQPSVSFTGKTDGIDVTETNTIYGTAFAPACSGHTTLEDQTIVYTWVLPNSLNTANLQTSFRDLVLPAGLLTAGTTYKLELQAHSAGSPNNIGSTRLSPTEPGVTITTGWPGAYH